MNDSLTTLLEKNIDLIMEGFNLDESGNLVVANKKKVAEADELFHQYFVKRMNQTFRQINESDPILGTAPNMHPMGAEHGMHGMGMPQGQGHGMQHGHGGMPDGMGMGDDGGFEQGLGGDEQMGDMAMDDMHGDPMGHASGGMGMGGGQMGGQMGGHGGMHDPAMESDESGEYDWVFNEDSDFEVDSLFNNLNEDDEEEEAEGEEDEHLKEFMDDGMQSESDFLPGGGMDHDGGSNDFGGDMGGGNDMEGGDDMGGDDQDGDMMTIHGQMDNGGEFEFSFDKDALGFGGGDDDDMNGMDDMSGGQEQHDGQEHEQPGMGSGHEDQNPMESAEGFHNGKPGKGKRGPKTSRMSIVPADPAANHAGPFPTPQGSRQKK